MTILAAPWWFWLAMAAMAGWLWLLTAGRLEWLGFSSWERVEFDFANYAPLRNQGLSHRQAHQELKRLWDAR